MNENTANETVDYVELLAPIVDAAEAAYSGFTNEKRLTTVEVPAGQLAAGDTFRNGDVVEAKRIGSTKAIVKMQGLKTEKRFDTDEVVTVQREVVTEDSQARRTVLFEEYRSLRVIAQNAAEPTADKAKLDEYMAKGWYEQVAVYAAELAASERVRGEWINAAALVDACISGYDAPTWSGGFTVKNAIQQSIVTNRQKAAQSAGRGW